MEVDKYKAALISQGGEPLALPYASSDGVPAITDGSPSAKSQGREIERVPYQADEDVKEHLASLHDPKKAYGDSNQETEQHKKNQHSQNSSVTGPG